MKMQGQQLIPADRETVWNALNDPEILKVCIPGCQELVKLSDTEMTAVAVIKVGPVSARFQGAVTLSNLNPPNGYTITGEGQGGVAGFAKGTAAVQLEAVDGGTMLNYEVDAQIGGKLSQLGGRLIDATAKKLAGSFFEKFGKEILLRQQGGAPASAPAMIAPEGKPQAGSAADHSPVAQQGATAQAGNASAAMLQAAPASSGTASFFKLVAAAVLGAAIMLVWLQYGSLVPGLSSASGVIDADGRPHLSPEFASAVQLIMAAAIGYLFGARK